MMVKFDLSLNSFHVKTHHVDADAWAPHLIKVIKELQDSENAGSNEKSHVSTDITWKKIRWLIKRIIHYGDRRITPEYNAAQ